SVVPQQSHPAVVGHLVFRNLPIIISFNQAGFGSTEGAFSNRACSGHMTWATTVHAAAFSHPESTFFRREAAAASTEVHGASMGTSRCSSRSGGCGISVSGRLACILGLTSRGSGRIV